MKSLFAKAIKFSFVSVAAAKATQISYRKYQQRSQLAEALYEDTPDDIVNTMMKQEFIGDLSHLRDEVKAKYEFKNKTRDDHLKALMDPTA